MDFEIEMMKFIFDASTPRTEKILGGCISVLFYVVYKLWKTMKKDRIRCRKDTADLWNYILRQNRYSCTREPCDIRIHPTLPEKDI
jgi:hypothetical protein